MTREQGLISPVLGTLGLEAQPARTVDGNVIYGGDTEYKITDETIAKITALKDKTFVLESNGNFKEG